MSGITKELSQLRHTVLQMSLMIQEQKQEQDQKLISFMQRISDIMPSKSSPDMKKEEQNTDTMKDEEEEDTTDETPTSSTKTTKQ